MKPVSDIIACVADHGIFLPVARRLAREFKKVYYFVPHEKAFPSVADIVGDGFDDIEIVESPWQVKDECSLFVFPDIGFSAEQKELLSQGKPVWGARDADLLEISRGKFMQSLLETDLPIPKFFKIIGMNALRDHLRDKEHKYIKISRFRGDWETLHWRNWEQDESELDQRAVKLGPWKEKLALYVFDPIDTEIEDGVDAYCIDGQWPETVVHGMELKDKAYIGTFQAFSELPEQVRKVNEAYSPILKGYQYRSMFSCEVRITKDNESYFIDPTCRAGSPPSQVMCEMIGNLGEIIWHGANGELVEPVQQHKFGVQALLSVKGDRRAWAAVQIPPELEQWVKCGFCSQIDGRLVFPPDKESPSGDIGWLVGVGDTMDEAIEHLKENNAALPDGLSSEYGSLSELLKEIKSAESSGMEFTPDAVPAPSSVLT